MRILVAEDEPSTLQMIKMYLEKWGHEVICTEDGVQAWDVIQNQTVNFVVSDWTMPNMSGLELCLKIRETELHRYIYFILLTANHTTTKVIEGMEAGADDYVIKPFKKDELKVRIRAGERILNLERKLEERNERLTKAYVSMKKDVEAAATMQSSLLPEKTMLLKDVKFASLFMPCSIVAGDIFNYFQLDETHVAFYLLDVVGHGVPAAMLSVTLSKLLTPQLNSNTPLKQVKPQPPFYEITPPVDAMNELNSRFQTDSDSMQYFTMVYGVIDTFYEKLCISQAGHPNPIILKRDHSITLIEGGGFPVGMFPKADYVQTEMDFRPGDRLLVYSDGITECANHKRQQYTLERLLDLLEEEKHLSGSEILARLETSLLSWRGNRTFDDDISILAIERITGGVFA